MSGRFSRLSGIAFVRQRIYISRKPQNDNDLFFRIFLKYLTQKSFFCNFYFAFFGNFPVEFAFFLVRMGRDFDVDRDKEIAFLIFGNMFDAVSFEFQDFAVLRTGFYFHAPLSENRKFQGFLGSEHRFDRIDFDGIKEIDVFASESLDMLRNCESNIQISALGSDSVISLSANLDGHPVVDPCGYVDFFLSLDGFASLPMACGAFFRDDLPGSLAHIAYPRLFHDPENSLGPPADLPSSVALRTFFRFRSLFRAGSGTLGTHRLPVVRNGFFETGQSFGEADFYANLDILALDATRSAPCSAVLLESATEKGLENIREVHIHMESALPTTEPTSHIGRSESVVVRAFLRIAEGRIGFVHLLEEFFFFLISAVPIRMHFHRLFAVRAFEFFCTHIAGYFQYIVKFVCHKIVTS